MRLSYQTDSQRTFDQLLDEYVDAVGQEFGLTVNVHDIDDVNYVGAMDYLYDHIRAYATQQLVENLLKRHPRLPLKKDEEAAKEAKNEAILELKKLPGYNIAPMEKGRSLVERQDIEHVPCLIGVDESEESLRSRFDRAIDNATKAIFGGPAIGL